MTQKQANSKSIPGLWLSAASVICVLMSSPLYGQAVNSASGAAIVAPGSLVSVFGKFTTDTGQAKLPLPISEGGIYFVPWDGKGEPNADPRLGVPLLYWSPSQVNVLLPYSATDAKVLFSRSTKGYPNGSVPLAVAAQAPGIFVNPASDCSILAVGCGLRLVRGILTDGNYGLIDSINPAHPGQSLVVWVTGLGITLTWPEVLISPSIGSPAAASVFYTGHTSFAGLDQVNVTLPQGNALSPGCSIGAHLEVQLSMKSTVTGIQSNTIALPVITDSCN